MKFHHHIIVFFLVTVLFACTSINPLADQNTPYPLPVQNMQSPPEEVGQSNLPYPQFVTGDTILPGVAEGLLASSAVDKITIKKSGEALLLLKDGRALLVLLPFEGVLQTWIDRCGEACKAIEIIQE